MPMQCIASCIVALMAGSIALSAEPLTKVQDIPMPGVEGRIDHLAADVSRQRLFVAALGNNTVEVIDLQAGKVFGQIKDVQEAQGIVLFHPAESHGAIDVPRAQQLAVSSGKDGSVNFYDPRSLQLLGKLAFGEDADNLRYDRESGRVYIAYGAGAIGIMEPDPGSAKMRKAGELKLKAHPESFQLEHKGPRIFVNVPDAGEVAVIDRDKRKVTAEWPVKDAKANFPMALDEEHHRLFIGCRKPARLLVLDSRDGKTIATAEMSGDVDDLLFDAKRQRLYAACGEGYLDVFEAKDVRTSGSRGDSQIQVQRMSRMPTAAGARTGTFAPETGTFYLAVPHRGQQQAQIRVFKAEG